MEYDHNYVDGQIDLDMQLPGVLTPQGMAQCLEVGLLRKMLGLFEPRKGMDSVRVEIRFSGRKWNGVTAELQ